MSIEFAHREAEEIVSPKYTVEVLKMSGGGLTGYWTPVQHMRRPWVLRVNGKIIRDKADNPRRFGSVQSARRAWAIIEVAEQYALQEAQS